MCRFSLLAVFVMFFSSCNKDNTIADEKAMAGTYSGQLQFFDNTLSDSTPVQVQIQVLPSIKTGEMSVANGVLIASTVLLSGNRLEMKPTIVASSSVFKIVEYAGAQRSGKQLFADFHEDRLDSNGKKIYFKEWRGQLLKQ